MKRKLIWIAIALTFAHFQLETSELLEKEKPELTKVYVKPLLSKNFKAEWYIKDGMNILWWVKHNSDKLLLLITYFIMTRVAYEYSRPLCLIIGLYFGYHVFDTIMMWWNWQSSHWVYWLLNIIIAISMVIIIYPQKNKEGILKQF